MLVYRTALALAVSTIKLAHSHVAYAQETPAPTASATDPAPVPAATDEQYDIIVTGTRAVGRSRLDSASPVDVLSGGSLQRQGTTELATALFHSNVRIAPSNRGIVHLGV